jgi:hypothetical protein
MSFFCLKNSVADYHSKTRIGFCPANSPKILEKNYLEFRVMQSYILN